MILSDVMGGIATRLATISGLRVFEYPPDSPTPPCAYPSLPDEIDFDLTAARGTDGMNIPVIVMVSKADSRSGVKALVPYLDGAGAKSIKAAIEADVTLSGSVDSVRVVSAVPQIYQVPGAEGEFLGARFLVNVI